MNDAEVEARLTHMYRAVATQVTAVPPLPRRCNHPGTHAVN